MTDNSFDGCQKFGCTDNYFDNVKKSVELLKNSCVFIDKNCFLMYDVMCISDSGGSLPIFGETVSVTCHSEGA